MLAPVRLTPAQCTLWVAELLRLHSISKAQAFRYERAEPGDTLVYIDPDWNRLCITVCAAESSA